MCHIVNTPKDNRFAVIMDGPVASGKGEQSRLIVSAMGGVHISTGDIARQKRETCSEFADKYGHLLDSGKYLPDNIVFGLIREFIPKIADKKGVIIGDGLIRTRPQAANLGTIFAKPALMCGYSIIIPEEVALIRAKKRFEKQGRPDDYNEKTILTRYRNWERNKERVHKKLRSQGLRLIEVDGNKSIEEVNQTIYHHLEIHLNRQKQEWEDSRSFAQPKRRRQPIIRA